MLQAQIDTRNELRHLNLYLVHLRALPTYAHPASKRSIAMPLARSPNMRMKVGVSKQGNLVLEDRVLC